MRYGMAYSILARIDASGATTPVARIGDGYARIDGVEVALEALHHKDGGLDFALLDRDGAPRDAVRLTRRAMAPVRNEWLAWELHRGDLWLADNDGHAVRFALE